MKRSVLALVSVAAVSAAGVAVAHLWTEEPPERTRPGPRAAMPETPPASATPFGRGATRPDHAIFDNRAFGKSKPLLARAKRDLEMLGFWSDLTQHLYVVKVASRLGRTYVPDDGHLADAFLTAQIDEGGQGGLCDIMFFPTAIADDLQRWSRYHEQGYIADPPPTPRQFWAALLAHELAHCLNHGSGETVAERWEARVLEKGRGRL